MARGGGTALLAGTGMSCLMRIGTLHPSKPPREPFGSTGLVQGAAGVRKKSIDNYQCGISPKGAFIGPFLLR